MTTQVDQHQIPVAYPPTSQTMPPPPLGYPTRDPDAHSHPHPPSSYNQSRGDGFWKGCCAALCCCCVLDACF